MRRTATDCNLALKELDIKTEQLEKKTNLAMTMLGMGYRKWAMQILFEVNGMSHLLKGKA